MRRELCEQIDQDSPSPRDPLVLQHIVSGDDVGVSVLAENGRLIAWTIQRHLPAKLLRFWSCPAALAVAERLMRETRYSGVAHIDFLDSGDGHPVLLECNPRFWASLTASCHIGVNFAELAVRQATTGGVEPQAREVTGDCGRATGAMAPALWGAMPPPATRAFHLQRLSDPLPGIYTRLSRLSASLRNRG